MKSMGTNTDRWKLSPKSWKAGLVAEALLAAFSFPLLLAAGRQEVRLFPTQEQLCPRSLA